MMIFFSKGRNRTLLIESFIKYKKKSLIYHQEGTLHVKLKNVVIRLIIINNWNNVSKLGIKVLFSLTGLSYLNGFSFVQ